MRKTIRQTKFAQSTARPTAQSSQRFAQILRSELNRQTSTQTQDLDAPYLFPNIPNSGRKRKAATSYQPPKTRSQAKYEDTKQDNPVEGTRPRKIIKLKLPSGQTPAPRPPALASSRETRTTRNQRPRQRDARGRFLPKNRAMAPVPNIPQGETVKHRDIQQLQQLRSFLVPKD
jgi:hypothetical protein